MIIILLNSLHLRNIKQHYGISLKIINTQKHNTHFQYRQQRY